MLEKVTVNQRRARLVARHHLASPAASVTGAAEAMIALHATDPLTVYLSAWARTRCSPADVDSELYEERRSVRMLGMRRTMWVLPAGHLPVVQAACTDDVAARLRGQLARDLERLAGISGAGNWLRDVEDGALRALEARGSAAAAQLSEDEPRLRTVLQPRTDKSYDRPQNITSRVLMLMSAEGRIVRGHRRGAGGTGAEVAADVRSRAGGGPAVVGRLDEDADEEGAGQPGRARGGPGRAVRPDAGRRRARSRPRR